MDEELFTCDCPDPIDYSDKLDTLIAKLDSLVGLLTSLQEIGLYQVAAAFSLLGLGVVVGFFVGWRAK